ncbi:MAG: N-acetylmuramoyl-L-alanine amidase, partial [Defluviitaleaceae bacterium]|nr:N-acetylmuramoyl-L-alanine amidase [Defluviitaleaceae bacterium]
MSKKIFIDPGHGGRDPGAVANSLRESEIVLDVARELDLILKSEGLDVRLSRNCDLGANERLGIDDRWRAANAWGADYYISIHANAGGGTGAETFFAASKPDDLAFARTVNDTYAAAMELRNRRVAPDTQTHVGSLGVLRFSRMPAILVELGFVDAPMGAPDVDILRNRRRDMAQALADGIIRHLGIEQIFAKESNDANRQFAREQTIRFNIDGIPIDIDGYIENGTTYARARQLLEALGYDVGWDADAAAVLVNRKAPIGV